MSRVTTWIPLIAMSGGCAMMLHIVGGGARGGVALLLESQVHVAGAVNVLDLLGVHFVLLDVVCVIIETVADSVDFTSDFFFNFGLAVNLPNLSELLSQLEVHSPDHKSIRACLMHRSNSVDVKLFGHSLESSRQI